MVNLDPAYIQRNIQSLAAIGGLYDLIAWEVETRHADILRQYRLDTGAKSLADLFAERGQQPQQHQHTNERTPNAEDDRGAEGRA